jgi:hypothetical protein
MLDDRQSPVPQELSGIRREEPQVRAFLHRLGLRRRKVATVPGTVDEAVILTRRLAPKQAFRPACERF